MPTEWSTDAHNSPEPGDGAPLQDFPTDRSSGVDEAPETGSDAPSPGWEGSRAAAEGAADDEDEMHRSAVDAVDGLLDEVELALARLDDGTYGRCEECGEAIDDGRLAALPIIRTCGSWIRNVPIRRDRVRSCRSVRAPVADPGLGDPDRTRNS